MFQTHIPVSKIKYEHTTLGAPGSLVRSPHSTNENDRNNI